MDPDGVYAVAALIMSLVAAVEFGMLRFTNFALVSLLVLGVGVFLATVFVAGALYEARRKGDADGGASSATEAAADDIRLGKRLRNINGGAILRSTGYSVVAFVLAGLGIGFTGALAILESGNSNGTFLGSSLTVVVVAVTFVIESIVGLATGLVVSDGALDGFLGVLTGFLVMMVLIVAYWAWPRGKPARRIDTTDHRVRRRWLE